MNRILYLLILLLSGIMSSCINTDKKTSETDVDQQSRPLVSENKDYTKYAPEIQSQLRHLDSIYDLGLFYFRDKGSLYYIPVVGEFKNPENGRMVDKGSYQMGILGPKMDTLLNFEYDKIGNPNALADGWLEVEKDGKFGLYNLQSKVLISPKFEAIYPFDHSYSHPYIVKVKMGDRFGILPYGSKSGDDVLFASDGYFNEAVYFQSPFVNKEFLRWEFDLENTKWKPLLNMHEEYHDGDPNYARCVVLAPSYMMQARILDEYNEGLMMEGEVDFGYTTYKGAIQLAGENDGIVTRIVSFMQRFSEARGELVETQRLVSSDKYGNELDWEVLYNGHQDYDNCRKRTFRFIDSALLEVCISQKSTYAAYDERDAYHYYKIHSDGQIEKLSSNRLFQFTEFVMMDSTYFNACLFRQLHDSAYAYPGKGIRKEHYDRNDLNWMIAEIYADNKMRILDKQWNDSFEKRKWYRPSLEANDNQLSLTDQHNLKIIRERLSLMKDNEKEWTKEEKVHAAYTP